MREESKTYRNVLLFILWLGLNVADAFWLYFYVMSIVDPIPRNAVNRTSSGWTAYTTLMFMFGLPMSITNLVFSWMVFVTVVRAGKDEAVWVKRLIAFLVFFVIIPAGIFISLIPFFGGWIITPIVQRGTWNHRCDGYPMYAILDAKAYNSPSYLTNVAHFYINGHRDSQFTYEISNPEDDSVWFFRLRSWNVDQRSIPLDAYPTLQSVSYNFLDHSVSGNCTVPSSPSVFDNATSTAPCFTGTFDYGDHLFFNLTSSVPLNNTANATLTQPTTSLLGIRDAPWYVDNSPPALILREQDERGELRDGVVLRTAVTKPHDCTQIKVCIAGVEGREGGQVMAEVMAPLGAVLMRQSDFGAVCSIPAEP